MAETETAKSAKTLLRGIAEAQTDRSDHSSLAYLPEILRYAFGRLGSKEEAEDVTMEVYAAVFERMQAWDRTREPKLYLFGIARRKVADALRVRRRDRSQPVDVATPLAEDSLIRQRAVEELLETLTADQREALLLKYVHGLSVGEIAKLMRKRPGAVTSLLQRGRAAFAERGEGLF